MQAVEVEEAFLLEQFYNVREGLMLYLKATVVGVLVGLLSAILSFLATPQLLCQCVWWSYVEFGSTRTPIAVRWGQ